MVGHAEDAACAEEKSEESNEPEGKKFEGKQTQGCKEKSHDRKCRKRSVRFQIFEFVGFGAQRVEAHGRLGENGVLGNKAIILIVRTATQLAAIGLHESLHLLDASQTEGDGQNSFLLETAVPETNCDGPKEFWVGIFEEGGAKFIVQFEKFEERHSSEVASTVALLADWNLDGVSFCIDSLFGGRRNEGLEEFRHTAFGDTKFLEEGWIGYEGLFALIAQAANEALIEDRG